MKTFKVWANNFYVGEFKGNRISVREEISKTFNVKPYLIKTRLLK